MYEEYATIDSQPKRIYQRKNRTVSLNQLDRQHTHIDHGGEQ